MKKLFQKQQLYVCLITVLCFGITAISYGQAVVSIEPAQVVSPAVGQQMTVTIKIANGTRVAGYDLTIEYDTSALQYVEITNSTYLPTGAFVAPVKVSSGRIIFAATSLASAVTASSGTLATLKFKVLAVKRSTLRLVDVVLADPNGNALAVTKRDANVVVTQSLPTDINGDGRVNVQDLVLVARDLGKTGSLATDLNKDKRVNVQDLVLVARDLGKTTGGDTATDTDSEVQPPDGGATGDADAGDADAGDADAGDTDIPVTPPTSDWQVTITASDPDGKKLNTTGTAPIAVNTSDEIAITVQLKYKGKKASGALLFSVEGKTGFKLAKSKGTTDNNAEVENVLTIGNLEGNYKFIVKKESLVLGEAAITLKELIFKATEGPGANAASIEIVAPNAVDPADKTISITAKVKTAAGHAVVGAPVTIKRLSGPAIQKLPDKRPVTNNKGEVDTRLRLTSSSTGKLKIQVYTGPASSEKTVEVRHTLGRVSFVNGLRSSITTGLRDTVEVRALSRSGTPMPGVSLKFSENSSQLRFTTSSGTTSSSSSRLGKFSTIVQTKGKTTGYWSGTTYKATGSEKITVTASHTARYGNKVTKTITASTKVIPKRQERQTPAAYFKSDQDWWPNWYWTDWVNLSLPSDCNKVLSWWGYATVSVVDDPFVDEENITREDESSIKKTGARTWKVRVHIKEHVGEPTEVWVRVKAYCEVIDSTFGAPSLQQPQPYPETYHLSEIWQELSQVPSETALLANYPNPFNPETWLPYQLSESAEVTLTIYSMDGNLVRRLDLGHKAAGFYQSRGRAAYWDGRNNVGEKVASGIYFYTLTAGDFSATRKMLIMK